jgi:hypothetical protein
MIWQETELCSRKNSHQWKKKQQYTETQFCSRTNSSTLQEQWQRNEKTQSAQHPAAGLLK